MKRLLLFILITSFLIMSGCDPEAPTAAKLNVTLNQLAISKMVAVGNSLTAGFQSSGLVQSFQENSFPYLIAQQMGKADDFEQPLINAPGLGSPAGKTPQSFDPATGAITQDDLTIDPLFLLLNAFLERPYDNLAVPGADLDEMLNATDSTGNGNPFFDLVLRNPNLGNTTMIEQAIALRPTLMLIWAGNNDVLGAALAGGGVNGDLLSALITSQSDFQTRFTSMMTQIRAELTNTALLVANIPNVTDIPYINTVDITFNDSPTLGINVPIPVIFDETFQPVAFDVGLYIPLLTEEGTSVGNPAAVSHVTLPGLLAYQTGIGVPDSAALVGLGLSPGQARQIEAGMIASGLNPTGVPLSGDMTLTVTEATDIATAVTGFNQTITNLAPTFVYQIIDANARLNELNTTGLDGLSGKFVLLDPMTTAFSLDGVHPNNAGHAVIANEFIGTINQTFSLSIPTLTVSQYAGQYLGKPVASKMKTSFDGVRQLFTK